MIGIPRPPRRAYAITSTTNAHALGAQVLQIAIGFELVEGIAQTRALDSFIGHGSSTLVPWLIAIAGVGSLVASVAVVYADDQAKPLRTEAVATAIWAVMTIAYGLSLTVAYGWKGGATTQSWAWIAGTFALLRVAQAVHDRRRLMRARVAAKTVPALGDPDSQGA